MNVFARFDNSLQVSYLCVEERTGSGSMLFFEKHKKTSFGNFSFISNSVCLCAASSLPVESVSSLLLNASTINFRFCLVSPTSASVAACF